jgi:hypothetical protein
VQVGNVGLVILCVVVQFLAMVWWAAPATQGPAAAACPCCHANAPHAGGAAVLRAAGGVQLVACGWWRAAGACGRALTARPPPRRRYCLTWIPGGTAFAGRLIGIK